VDLVKRRTLRSIAAVGVFALVVTGLYASTATAAPKYEFRFVTQPVDSEMSPAPITGVDFVGDSNFVQVGLFDKSTDLPVTNVKQTVTFGLAAGTLAAGTPDEEPAAIGRLRVIPQPLVNGVATFGLDSLGVSTLKIDDPNEPQFTSYALVPRNTKGALITGPASSGFDIFEDGCNSSTTCDVTVRGDTQQAGEDTYSLLSPGTLGASEIANGNLPGFVAACEELGQTEIFAATIFVHESTDTANEVPAPVLLTSHITKKDMQAFPNNGQAHISWCTATLTEAPWIANGGEHLGLAVDVNGNGDFLWVGLAPACPQADPSSNAPCIVSQNGDGAGGSITTGYLLGGDPPKRS
jgi:hypothetical protein